MVKKWRRGEERQETGEEEGVDREEEEGKRVFRRGGRGERESERQRASPVLMAARV